MDRDKKISFGFSKLNKKPLTQSRNTHTVQEKVELVECLEGRSIKIKDAPVVTRNQLIIPIKDNKKSLLDRVRDAKTKQTKHNKTETEQEDNRPESELSIEELAARELINDAKKRLSNKETEKIFVLPIKDDKSTFEGETEPTLDDYETIPVSDFGMAMLRGMGWKEGMNIGRNPSKFISTQPVNVPELRPKGLGLGASRMITDEILNEPVCDKDGKLLIVKKGTYVKIIAGSHKGKYCEVQGLDDEAGRVIVRTSLKGEILTLNECLIVPVTKEEFLKCGKVLNNAKFEEYNEKDNNFRNNEKLKSVSKQVDETGNSSRVYKENDYDRFRIHQSKEDSNEKIHQYNKHRAHSELKYPRSSGSKEVNSFSSNSDDDCESYKSNKKQKDYRDRKKSYENKYNRDEKNLKRKENSRLSVDHHKNYIRKNNKSKWKHSRSSSSDSDSSDDRNTRR